MWLVTDLDTVGGYEVAKELADFQLDSHVPRFAIIHCSDQAAKIRHYSMITLFIRFDCASRRSWCNYAFELAVTDAEGVSDSTQTTVVIDEEPD